MTATTSAPGGTLAPGQTTRRSVQELLSSDAAVLTGLLLSLALFYLVPGLPSAALGGLLFLTLTIYRPQLSLAIVPLTAPLFYRPRVLTSSFYLPLPEFVILCGLGAWVLRAAYTPLRPRRIPDLQPWLREPGIWLAAAFGVIGLLWLLVPPDANLRKIALREFRWTVAEPLIFLGLMLRWLRTERDIWRMVGAWLVAAALVGREGVDQFLFGETWSMEGVGRVSSIYPSATALGIYMGRALPLALVLAVFLPRDWRAWKIACALLSVAMAGGVLFSFARAAWIGVFVALLVVTLITRYRPLVLTVGVAALLGALGLVAGAVLNIPRITSLWDF